MQKLRIILISVLLLSGVHSFAMPKLDMLKSAGTIGKDCGPDLKKFCDGADKTKPSWQTTCLKQADPKKLDKKCLESLKKMAMK
jgi:hypothetical protein